VYPLDLAAHGAAHIGHEAQIAVTCPGIEPELEAHQLPIGDEWGEHRAVALVVKVGLPVERLVEDAAALPALEPVELDLERAARALGVALIGVAQQDAVVSLGAEAVGRAGQVEVETQAAPLHVGRQVRRNRLAGEAKRQYRQLAGKGRDVENVEGTDDAGYDQ